MGSVKWWYVYLVSAITLNAVAWAVISLIRELTIRQLETPVEALALMIAVIVVGLPIYLVHWLWAQRSAANNPEDRAALPRMLYLFIIAAVFLAPLIVSAFGVLKALLHLAFGVSPVGYWVRPPSQSLWFHFTAVVILTLLWFYHWRIRTGDLKVVPQTDASTIVRHLYIYAFAGAGLVLTAMGAGNLIQWIMASIAAGTTPADFGRLYIADVIARLVVGVAVWVPFWLYAQRLFQGPEEREQESIVRKIYLYLIVLASVLTVVSTITVVLTDLFEGLFDVPSYGPSSGGDIRLPVSIIIVSGIIWAYHAYVLRQDAIQARGLMQQAAVRRIYLYLVAGIGLASVLAGIAGEISVLIRAVGGPGLIISLREQMAIFTAMLMAGLPVWLVNWRQVQIKAADPGELGLEERSALVRRIYLYFFIFVATMAILSNAVFVVWQIVQLALGESVGSNLFVDLGQPLGFIVVAAAVWIYHGSILRREGALIKKDIASRQKPVRVAVIDDDDGSLGMALIDRIKAKVPSATVQPLALGSAAQTAMNGSAVADSPDSILAEAEVIVGPWHMAVAGSAGGLITESIAQTIITSPAHKVIIPVREQGWEWTGVERWKVQDIVKDVTETVEQLALDRQPKARSKLNPVVIVAIVLITLCLLTTFVPGIIFFIFQGLFY
jgi:hypothetical protein